MSRVNSRLFDVEVAFASSVTRAKRRQLKRVKGADSPLYIALWPMIYVIRIFGLAPYGFSKDRLVPSNFYIIFTLVIGSLYTYVMYLVYLRFNGLKREKPLLGGTETLKVVRETVVFNFFVAMFDLLHALLTRSRFVKIWNMLQDFDENVRQLGYPRNESKTKKWAWTLAIFHTIVWTLVNRSGMNAFLERWMYNVGYMIIYVGTFVSVYKFVGMVLVLGQRFKHLNEMAKKNIPPRTAGDLSSTISIKTIESLHNELMMAGEELAMLYSWSLIFWLGNLSVHTVSNIFFIIDWLLPTPWQSLIGPLIFCLLTWLLSFISQLLALNIACDYASTAANSIRPIIIEWQIKLSKEQNDVNPKSTFHFINRPLQFSAAGCFSVDLPLLRSIAAILSTYLVILLQFPAQ